MFYMIENPISADIQIRFIDFVALQSGFVFSAKHKFENFVLIVCEINFYCLSTWDSFDHGWQSKEESWSPKIKSQVGGCEGTTNSFSSKVDDIYVLSADITYVFSSGLYTFDLSDIIMRSIRTPGTNRGLDIQNLNFHLREVPVKAALTLWRIVVVDL